MNSHSYCAMSVHGVIGATLIALERGLIVTDHDAAMVYDTPAGSVRAHMRRGDGLEDNAVGVVNVPAFVLHAGLPLNLGTRQVLADIAFGGRLVAVVDAEAAGVGMAPHFLPELRRMGTCIIDAAGAAVNAQHPADPRLKGLDGVVFTGPAAEGRADVRSVLVLPNGALERCPSGTGASAVMAVLHAMGILNDDTWLVSESLIGTRFRGRIVSRTQVGDHDAVVTEIESAAWITGDHAFTVSPEDPMRNGFVLGLRLRTNSI
jgi:proline racemase/trans-L-3-hydroxyproline dehydratase